MGNLVESFCCAKPNMVINDLSQNEQYRKYVDDKEKRKLELSKKWGQYESCNVQRGMPSLLKSHTYISNDNEEDRSLNKKLISIHGIETNRKTNATPRNQRLDFEIMKFALVSQDQDSSDSDNSCIEQCKGQLRHNCLDKKITISRRRAELGFLKKQQRLSQFGLECKGSQSARNKLNNSMTKLQQPTYILGDLQQEIQFEEIRKVKVNGQEYEQSCQQDFNNNQSDFRKTDFQINTIKTDRRNEPKYSNACYSNTEENQLCNDDDSFLKSILSRIEEEQLNINNLKASMKSEDESKQDNNHQFFMDEGDYSFLLENKNEESQEDYNHLPQEIFLDENSFNEFLNQRCDSEPAALAQPFSGRTENSKEKIIIVKRNSALSRCQENNKKQIDYVAESPLGIVLVQ